MNNYIPINMQDIEKSPKITESLMDALCPRCNNTLFKTVYKYKDMIEVVIDCDGFNCSFEQTLGEDDL